MRKTTIYLSDSLRADIKQETARRGVSEAEVIRSAIESGLSRPFPRGALFAADPFADRADEMLAGLGDR